MGVILPDRVGGGGGNFFLTPPPNFKRTPENPTQIRVNMHLSMLWTPCVEGLKHMSTKTDEMLSVFYNLVVGTI